MGTVTGAPRASGPGPSSPVARPAAPAGARDRPWLLAAALLVVTGLVLPHHALASRVAEAGGLADLDGGFLLLRVLLIATGTVMAIAARTGAGTNAIGVVRDADTAASVHGSRRDAVLLGGLLLIALVLRLPQLGAGLWHDEIATLLHNVRAPVASVLTNFESQNNHPLYSLLAKAAFAIGGDSPALLRLPAVLFGVAGIGAVGWLGVQLGRAREGLLAAALLAASYHHVWFSQNARAYTALLLFAVVGTGLCVRLCRERTDARRDAVAYALVMALAVYSHLTAGLIVVGHALVWAAAVAVRRRLPHAWRSAPVLAFLLAGLFSLILYAPGLTRIAAGLGGSGPAVAVEWKNPLWMAAELVRGLSRAVPGGIAALAIAAIVPAAGLVDWTRREPVVTGLMIVPALVTAALLLATGHNLWPRFFFFAAGFGALIAMRGVFLVAARLAPRRADLAGTLAAAILVAGSAVLVPSAWGPKQDFGGALDWVEEARAGGDAVATAGLAAFTFREYLGQDWPAVESAADLDRLASAHDRVWLLYSMPELIAAHSPDLWAAIQRDYRRAALFPGTLAGGAIFIMVNE